MTTPRSDDHVLDAAVSRSVVAQIEKGGELSPDAAKRALAEVVKFLEVSAEMTARGEDVRLVPSVPVDSAWHAFILHTRAYADFCDRAFGEYLHHDPSPPDEVPGPGTLVDYLRTRVLIEERYGALDEELWPLP